MNYILFVSKPYSVVGHLIPYSFIVHCYLNNITELPVLGVKLGTFNIDKYIKHYCGIEGLTVAHSLMGEDIEEIRDVLSLDGKINIKTIQEGEIYLGTDEQGLDVYCTLHEKYGTIHKDVVCLVLEFRTEKREDYICTIANKLKEGRAKASLSGLDIKLHAFNDRIYSEDNHLGLMLDLHSILFGVAIKNKNKLDFKNITLHSIEMKSIKDCRFTELVWCNITEIENVNLFISKCRRISMENVYNSTVEITNSEEIFFEFARHATIKVDDLSAVAIRALLHSSIDVSKPVKMGDMDRLGLRANKSADKALYMNHATISLFGGGDIYEIITFLNKWAKDSSLTLRLPEEYFRRVIKDYPEFKCKVGSIG